MSGAAVVIDTNVVLDAWVFNDPATQPLRDALERGELRWLGTEATTGEMAHVLLRPLPPRWESARLQALAIDFRLLQTICPAAPAAPQAAGGSLICSDPDDQKFIDLAVAQRCRWLITRDRALLRLARGAARHGVAVLSPRAWVADTQAPGQTAPQSQPPA